MIYENQGLETTMLKCFCVRGFLDLFANDLPKKRDSHPVVTFSHQHSEPVRPADAGTGGVGERHGGGERERERERVCVCMCA